MLWRKSWEKDVLMRPNLCAKLLCVVLTSKCLENISMCYVGANLIGILKEKEFLEKQKKRRRLVQPSMIVPVVVPSVGRANKGDRRNRRKDGMPYEREHSYARSYRSLTKNNRKSRGWVSVWYDCLRSYQCSYRSITQATEDSKFKTVSGMSNSARTSARTRYAHNTIGHTSARRRSYRAPAPPKRPR